MTTSAPATIATSQADLEAAAAIRDHHAQLDGALALAVARAIDSGGAAAAVAELAAWGERELLPHALAEEQTLYAAARTVHDARLLVTAMAAEHLVLADLVARLGSSSTSPFDAIAAAGALQTLFRSHLAAENDLLLPLLESAPGISVHDLLGQMHDQLEAQHAPQHAAPAAQTCACGHDDDELPVVDARTIPHAVRHASIFGALSSLQVGDGLVLVAPHDPLPLLAQLEAAQPGRFEVSYLQRGPEDWRLQLVRRS